MVSLPRRGSWRPQRWNVMCRATGNWTRPETSPIDPHPPPRCLSQIPKSSLSAKREKKMVSNSLIRSNGLLKNQKKISSVQLHRIKAIIYYII